MKQDLNAGNGQVGVEVSTVTRHQNTISGTPVTGATRCVWLTRYGFLLVSHSACTYNRGCNRYQLISR